MLPLFEVRGLLGGRALVSVPYAVYGGICARRRPPRGTALLDAATDLARSARRRLRGAATPGRAGAGDLPTKSLYVTFSRPISASEEENLEAIPRKQRRMTRQGVKYGLRAESARSISTPSTRSTRHSVHNLGSPVFPRRLFHALAAEFGKECELLTVWRNDEMLSGVLTLLYEDQALPYYGGALREALQYAVNDFMYWELMCHVAAAPATASSTSAGAARAPARTTSSGTGASSRSRCRTSTLLREGATMPNLSPSNPKMRLAVEAWKRLPLAVTKLAGPLLTRYLP